MQDVIALRPDRIALYSFAYVPWLKRHQKKFAVAELPTPEEKLEIFLAARERLLQNGYRAIAMDHFALESDELAKAYEGGTLYRNFMGYTVKPADEYLGFGLTAIGFLEGTYVHNHKILQAYAKALKGGGLPIERGKILSQDDKMRQWAINSLMCRFQLVKLEFEELFHEKFDEVFALEINHVRACIAEGLLREEKGGYFTTELGGLFIRNICTGFDKYLRRPKEQNLFSKAI